METLVPQISFQFLAIAMALAAFLPALMYSYVKGLVDELEQSFDEFHNNSDSVYDDIDNKAEINNKYEKIKTNIPKFVYAVDLIVTQSMVLVFFSGFVGVTIYLSSLITDYWNSWGIVLIIETVLYGFFILWSYRRINTYKNNFEEHWKEGIVSQDNGEQKWVYGWISYKRVWLGFSVVLILLIGGFSVVFLRQNDAALCADQIKGLYLNRGSVYLNIILSVLSLALIIYAISWVMPLIHYKPLMGRLDFIMFRIKRNNKVRRGG